MACMAPLQWLNDEVINLYISLLLERDMLRRKQVRTAAPVLPLMAMSCSQLTGFAMMVRFNSLVTCAVCCRVHVQGKGPRCHFFSTFFANKLYKDGGYSYDQVRCLGVWREVRGVRKWCGVWRAMQHWSCGVTWQLTSTLTRGRPSTSICSCRCGVGRCPNVFLLRGRPARASWTATAWWCLCTRACTGCVLSLTCSTASWSTTIHSRCVWCGVLSARCMHHGKWRSAVVYQGGLCIAQQVHLAAEEAMPNPAIPQ
jgi:hypothetical protein